MGLKRRASRRLKINRNIIRLRHKAFSRFPFPDPCCGTVLANQVGDAALELLNGAREVL